MRQFSGNVRKLLTPHFKISSKPQDGSNWCYWMPFKGCHNVTRENYLLFHFACQFTRSLHVSCRFARCFNWLPYLGSLILGNSASARMKSINPNISFVYLNILRLTHGINGIPHSLPNCHENYWDSPISSLRVVGIPQISPGVYGIPHALLCLSLKVFFRSFFFHLNSDIVWISTYLSDILAWPRSLVRHWLYLE